jgi:hypothetical protein
MIADLGTRDRELYAPADEVLLSVEADSGDATNLEQCAEGVSGEGLTAVRFAGSRERLEGIIGWLGGESATELEHSQLESRLAVEGRELLCALLQDHLDLRAERELRVEGVQDDQGVARRAVESGHQRPLASVFGEVTVRRLAYRRRGQESLYPADGVLNLPPERASHGVRRLVAVESSRGSFDDATDQVRERTGLRIGKRQVEELARLAAADFEEFYATQARSADEENNDDDDDDVLVLSADGKGIVMRPDALRPATAQAAQRAAPKLKTRLSRGEKRNRKRIAEVGAVYKVQAAPRTAADVLASAEEKTLPAPKAKRKWLCASVVEDAAAVVAKVFDEAQRRDPEHKRVWVALVDGNNHHCDTRSHATSEKRKIGGSANVESVIPGPYSTACPHPDVRRRFRPVGFGARGKAQGRPFHPGVTGKGKPGRVKNLNLRLMPRHVDPRWWDAGTGSKDWPLGSGRRRLGMVPSRDEYRRPRGTGGTHPGRISCAWNVVTPVGVRCCSAGKPTARKAQSPGGNLMVEKRMPAVERQQETGT